MSSTSRDRQLEAGADGPEFEPAPPPWEAYEDAPEANGNPSMKGKPTPDSDVERSLLRVALTVSPRQRPGGEFVFATSERPNAVWGDGDRIAWAEGEPFMWNGPTGTGKTTGMQQFVLRRIGLVLTDFLGMNVSVSDRRVLYIASDRPRQAARSLRRMVTIADRGYLDDRLVVWEGPLPHDLARNPQLLIAMAEEFDAGTVIVDSLKDVAFKLTDDETGARVNQAFQYCVAEGVEVGVLHHQRKAQPGGRVGGVDEIYGSTWLVNGMGSIVSIAGKPGDLVVELHHLKQPSEDIGPLKLLHDHRNGTTRIYQPSDIYSLLAAAPGGLTVADVAKSLYGATEANDQEKARRRLEAAVAEGKAHKVSGSRGGVNDGAKGRTPARYHLVVSGRTEP